MLKCLKRDDDGAITMILVYARWPPSGVIVRDIAQIRHIYRDLIEKKLGCRE